MRDFEDVEIIGMLRSYVNATLKGMGAIKGSCVTIASITRNQENTANVVTFSWEDNEGTTHTSTMTVPDGLSAYQVAVKNGFSGTEQEWLDSLHGDGSGGGSYDDTEVKADIEDIWKAQGELGAKNLLKYPYSQTLPKTIGGITFSDMGEGKIGVSSGTPSTYSSYDLYNENLKLILPVGDYIVSCNADEAFSDKQMFLINYKESPSIPGASLATCRVTTPSAKFSITQEIYNNIVNGNGYLLVRLVYEENSVINSDVIVKPMIRLATDPDDTWQPYAPTNRELFDTQNALAAIAGEYLVAYNGSTSKKRIVSVGATECFFYYGGFADKYGITSASNLNFDISAETASGNVVAYNQIVLNTTSRNVYIKFDELTEQTTFMCKCSKIQ